MRLVFVCFMLLLLILCLTPADAVDNPSLRPSPVRDFLGKHLDSPSFQLSLFSYKPELGGLADILQSVGVSSVPSALLPTFSVVFAHTPELDSRFEFGYWQMELDIPPPTSANLSTTLIPISYQFIYRPVLLSEFLPIYLGGGIGFLGTSFSGNAVDLLEQQGISFDDSSSGPTGYVIIGAELLQWEYNLALNLELKRILKTVETTGTTPLNLILDGTAIGLGVKMKF
ncbi:hypothetical protein F4Z99_00120 [Candidatus Poribacteria bacterium]|nr:hypothetical protein [Candidatus Poribacteria bacterium]MYA98054.1 hypothetical protein [Candidatus Poribacteria bacterium]